MTKHLVRIDRATAGIARDAIEGLIIATKSVALATDKDLKELQRAYDNIHVAIKLHDKENENG